MVIGFTSSSFAQNLGEYIYPFENRKLGCAELNLLKNHEEVLAKLFTTETYWDVEFQLSYQRQSKGGKHYSYQVFYQERPIEQCLVKIHTDFNDEIRLIQTNIPSAKDWKTIRFSPAHYSNEEVYLFHEGKFTNARKENIENEKEDDYANRFWIDELQYFENTLKYFSDTTAYSRVFQPDPLTSSNMSYGGNYSDGFSFDTSALLIQNLSNPGGNTITANATSYTYDGQSFNVPTESYVNSLNDPVLFQVFESIFLDGQGAILGFNTAITNNLGTYTTVITIEDYNFAALEQEQTWVSIPADFSNGTFNLLNDYFIIAEFSAPPTNATTSVSDTFDFNRSQLGFEDVNAFYHLNNFKNYWESLGFTDLGTQRILVDAHGNNGADNSFFSPTTPPRLVFGQGGVDDAEDADVLIHEYGHAMSSFASPGSNVDLERRALDEGFGDYLATSYSKQYDNFGANRVFSWDGHNEFWAGRMSNSNKTKQDISANQNIYFNGEVWSTTLNDLYQEIGATNTDILAIEVMYYNMPNTTISQAAENLFLADTLVFNGVHTCEIFDVLFARKFLVGSCIDFYSGIRNAYADHGGAELLNTYGFTHYNQDLILRFNEAPFSSGQVRLYDLNGSLLSSEMVHTNSHRLSYPQLPSGIYFLEIQTNADLYRFKLLKD